MASGTEIVRSIDKFPHRDFFLNFIHDIERVFVGIGFSGSVILSQTRETSSFNAAFLPRHFLYWTIKPSLFPRRIGLILKRLPTRAVAPLKRPVLERYFKSPTVNTPFILAGYVCKPQRLNAAICFENVCNFVNLHSLITHFTCIDR